MVRRDPRQCGVDRTRWTLDAVRAQCPWLHLQTRAGLSQVLDRLDLSWQRARSYLRSPDPHYEPKRVALTRIRAHVAASAGRSAIVYLDEVTLYRQPTLAAAWAARGDQPRARRSLRSDTPTRILGSLDAASGQVVHLRASHIGVRELVRFYQRLCAAYPPGTRIYVVQDNWPVHWHPDLLVALEPQETPWPGTLPASWSPDPQPHAVQQWGHLRLPIQIVPLPTYASWLNPIEKLWRQMRQELSHLHRLADDLPALRAHVDAFLDRYADGSAALLRYVGLDPPPRQAA